MKNILVLGGAGYIGSVFVESLLNKNYKVTVVDNFFYSQNSLNHLCNNDNLDIINLDVKNISELKKILKNFDFIFPLAAYVGAPLCNKDPIGAKLINYNSIIDLLNIISKDQILIMPTTNSAYGSGNKDNYCDENTKLKPK